MGAIIERPETAAKRSYSHPYHAEPDHHDAALRG